jgi:hypothetical protein
MIPTSFFVMRLIVENVRARSFPLDMLRYDSCLPATEADSRAIENSVSGDGPTTRVTLKRFARDDDRFSTRTALDRWLSFGWRVVAYEPWDEAR